MSESIGNCDEDALVAALRAAMGPAERTALVEVPNGDDSAVVACPDGSVTVSTDILVEGVHFRREWATAEEIGRRAVAQNLADAMAMGATPTGIVVAVAAGPSTPVEWLVRLAGGIGSECQEHGVALLGGDVSAGPAVVVSVTVLGDMGGRRPVLRRGAAPGDVVAHAGNIGWSAAGLAANQAGLDAADGAVGRARALFAVPQPPLTCGPAAAAAGATAMMDVSDGLVKDAGRLARASAVRVVLDAPEVAFADTWADLRSCASAICAADGAGATGVSAEELVRAWLLTGGEDHGLLATFPGHAALPAGFRMIGRVAKADGADGSRRDSGVTADVWVGGAPWSGAGGWDHFAHTRA